MAARPEQRLPAEPEVPLQILTSADVWMLENGRVQAKICDGKFLLRLQKDEAAEMLVWKNAPFWKEIDDIADSVYRWRPCRKKGLEGEVGDEANGDVTFIFRLFDVKAEKACSFYRDLVIASRDASVCDRPISAHVVQRASRGYAGSGPAANKLKRKMPGVGVLCPVPRELGIVHTYILKIQQPFQGHDPDWSALWSPLDEINLWKIPPAERQQLIDMLFQRVLMSAAILAEPQSGLAASGTMSGFSLVGPRMLTFPFKPRLAEMQAAMEIKDLWMRPSVRLIMPRYVLSNLSFTGRFAHWMGGYFEGTVIKGAYQGYCTLMMASCRTFWQGTFSNNAPHGDGRMTMFWPNGKLQFSFSGQWQFGVQHGHGVEHTSEENGKISSRAGVWEIGVFKGPPPATAASSLEVSSLAADNPREDGLSLREAFPERALKWTGGVLQPEEIMARAVGGDGNLEAKSRLAREEDSTSNND